MEQQAADNRILDIKLLYCVNIIRMTGSPTLYKTVSKELKKDGSVLLEIFERNVKKDDAIGSEDGDKGMGEPNVVQIGEESWAKIRADEPSRKRKRINMSEFLVRRSGLIISESEGRKGQKKPNKLDR